MARYKQSDPSDRLTTGLRVQLTPAQREELRTAAEASGARLSDYVRERLFRRGGQPVVAAGARRNPEAKAIMNELRRIGNNLNQLAHHANAQGLITDAGEIRNTIEQVKTSMSHVLGL